jgi:hypothetical protein
LALTVDFGICTFLNFSIGDFDVLFLCHTGRPPVVSPPNIGLFPDLAELSEQISFLILLHAAEILWYHSGTDLLHVQIFVKTNLIFSQFIFSAVF